MGNTKAIEKNDFNTNTDHTKTDSTVEVLYQKMGDRWFAFSLIEDEVFVGSISQAEIDMVEGGKRRLTRSA